MILKRLKMVTILVMIYTVSIYDIRKIFKVRAQQVKVEFTLDGVFPAGIYGYVLALTNRLVNKGSDGQRMFDLVYIHFFQETIIFIH